MKIIRSGPLLAAALITLPLLASEPLAIQDNSFLIEEAYTQGKGAVRHIFSFEHPFTSHR